MVPRDRHSAARRRHSLLHRRHQRGARIPPRSASASRSQASSRSRTVQPIRETAPSTTSTIKKSTLPISRPPALPRQTQRNRLRHPHPRNPRESPPHPDHHDQRPGSSKTPRASSTSREPSLGAGVGLSNGEHPGYTAPRTPAQITQGTTAASIAPFCCHSEPAAAKNPGPWRCGTHGGFHISIK